MGEKERLDRIIKDWEENPGEYEYNVWRCYSACKKEIVKMQTEGIVGHTPDDYNKLIDYISNKLDL